MLPGAKINEERKKLYYSRGDWSTKTVFDTFSTTVNKHPENIALVDNKQKLTYKTLFDKVMKFSAGLFKLGIKKGDFVSVQLPNWAENVIAYLSCAKIGAIYNPVPTNLRNQEVEYMLTLCESKVFIIPEEFRKFNYLAMADSIRKKLNIQHVVVVNNAQDASVLPTSFLSFEEIIKFQVTSDEFNDCKVASDDPLVVLFTSGTESKPKGVIHTHNTILFGERAMEKTLDITENDAIFMASPISHATGFLHGVNLPLIVGAKSVLMEHFSGEKALEIMSNEKCTFTMGATPFLHDLLHILLKNQQSYDLSQFRFFLCGGAPIPRHLVTQANKTGFKVLAVYGSSESPPHAVSRLADSNEYIVSYDGKALPGIEVKVVDENRKTLPNEEVGEQVSRGPNVFIGYFKHPELTEKYLDDEGWYYSGDLCVLHSNNYMRIVGRKKDIIIRGGQNISPLEIENILHTHPKIQNIAIVGVFDERMGEKACAFVVPFPGEEFTFDEMIGFLEEKSVAKFKYPEKLKIVDELPMTASGKIQKFRLQNMT